MSGFLFSSSMAVTMTRLPTCAAAPLQKVWKPLEMMVTLLSTCGRLTGIELFRSNERSKWTMDILIVMCLGILVGRFILSRRIQKGNEWLSLICTFVLIFSMGVMLGEKENFLEELSYLGFSSFLFFLIPTALSIGIVYILTKHFMRPNPTKAHSKEEPEA